MSSIDSSEPSEPETGSSSRQVPDVDSPPSRHIHRRMPSYTSINSARQASSLRHVVWSSALSTASDVFADPSTPVSPKPADTYPESMTDADPSPASSIHNVARHRSVYSLAGSALARTSSSSPALVALPRNQSFGMLSIATRERAKSTLLDPDALSSKTWLEKNDIYVRLSYWATYGCIFLGIACGAIRCYFGYRNALVLPDSQLCSVLNEDFSLGESVVFGQGGTFLREVDMSGFGNGEFQMTTSHSNNSFIRNNQLYIMPTLTQDQIGLDAVLNGYIWNSTDCTYNITSGHQSYTTTTTDSFSDADSSKDNQFDEKAYLKACSAVSNSTTGQVINPVQSARLITRDTASIKYGKVEIVAKIPKGDWLWPALWMLPVNNTYGTWPASGEIDIMESRGNGPDYKYGGSNFVRGALNWGPLSWLNSVSKTYGYWMMRRGSFADQFHTYSLEWAEDFIRIYVDSRLHYMLDFKLKKPFWKLGEYPNTVMNGTQPIALHDPWTEGTKNAPFDQPFYLIISLGIGSTNGWFPDDADKPWLDGSKIAARQFIEGREKWLPSWSEEGRAFIIDSVKMWQKC